MYHDLRICGRLVAYRLGQLENVRLDEIRLALERLEQQVALRIDDQLAAVALDGFAQLAVFTGGNKRGQDTIWFPVPS